MKKLLLSIFIIIVFIAYAFYQRKNNFATEKIATLPSNTNQSSLSNPNGQNSSNQPSTSQTTSNTYKDGSYNGSVTDAYYGNVQVKAIIQGGKITDVQFLDYPHDRQTSNQINSQAKPLLSSEAIQVQSAHVDIISGATLTSEAFTQSLQSALNQAII